ncbi:UNVERIFIED_CONTAM: hypothetical protein OHV15_08300 [Microbacterium sp. SLM126]
MRTFNWAKLGGSQIFTNRAVGLHQQVLVRMALGGSKGTRDTAKGKRFIDAIVGRTAIEVKAGRVYSTPFTRAQVLKDELVDKSPRDSINAAEWHFYASPVTGKVGPSGEFRKSLTGNGITICIEGVCEP